MEQAKIFDKDLSKIKLVVYTNVGDRKVFFSLFSDDAKGIQPTIEKMKNRILDNKFRNNYQTAIFYQNGTEKYYQKYIRGVLCQ